jgi:hypothetical protein
LLAGDQAKAGAFHRSGFLFSERRGCSTSQFRNSLLLPFSGLFSTIDGYG